MMNWHEAKASLVAGALATVMAGIIPATVRAQPAGAKKPNILILWGDDIGQFNISAYNMGMMGYKTPNIDRIAKEGAHLHRLVRPAELHRRAARRSSPASRPSAPASPRSACPARRKA